MPKHVSFVRSQTARPFTASEQEWILRCLNDPKSWPVQWVRKYGHRTFAARDWRITLESQAFIDALDPSLKGLSVTIFMKDGPETWFSYENWTQVPNRLTKVYNLDQYRRYLVLHEAGHALGLRHSERCEANGLAPIMMQQTKGLASCAPNTWPLPSEKRLATQQ